MSALEDAARQSVIWRALAHRIGQRDKIRLSENRKDFRRGWQRPLSVDPPAVPAAVYTYDDTGHTRVFTVDLDAPKTGKPPAKITRSAEPETPHFGGVAGTGNPDVDADFRGIVDLVASCGGQVITDHSPSGGRHIYIPLKYPVPHADASELARDMAKLFPTLDSQPMAGATDGLIRPPGSTHKAGGWQQLDGDLDAAVALADAGNPPELWGRLRHAVPRTPQQSAADGAAAVLDIDPDTPVLRYRGGPIPLTPAYERIASDGTYDHHRYPTPSEARMAVICSAVWAGHSFASVIARLEGGVWPGLRSMYSARHGHRWRKALTRDWGKATALVQKELGQPRKQPRSVAGEAAVHSCTTSKDSPAQDSQTPLSNTRFSVEQARRRVGCGDPTEYLFIRRWWSAMLLYERAHPVTPVARMVLRALGEAAMKAGSRFTAFGTRSLSVAVGVDHSQVGRVLRDLQSDSDGLIRLVERGRGMAADLYELRVPAELAEAVSERPVRPGQVHGLRAAFRELGYAAAFVYEAVEQAGGPASVADIAAGARLSRSAVYEAIRLLRGYDLATFEGGMCTLTGADLNLLAERLGCADEVRRLIGVHRVERLLWHLFLAGPAGQAVVDVEGRWRPPDRPPDVPPDVEGAPVWVHAYVSDTPETGWDMVERVRAGVAVG